jgi:glycosyltransferase involved in cell wall biosynthesis
MKIHLFAMCWNEAGLLPYFLRHYAPLCERIVIYDDGSDDGSQDIIRRHPQCELRDCSGGAFTQDKLLGIRKTWKESKGIADWVICCDIDEFLWHPDIPSYLNRCGVTVPKVQGFQMVADSFPTEGRPLPELINRGVPNGNYSKRIIFRPDAIDDMDYDPGCHHCHPKGNYTEEKLDGELRLLHYKWLGMEHILARNKAMDSRQNDSERKKGHGNEYRESAVQVRKYYDFLMAYATKVTE